MKLKISRLFHWLYATLMFLPILMFIPSCLYYSFNEHAANTETTTINYKYQSNEVNSLDDLVVGNIYQFNSNNETIDSILDLDGYCCFKLLSNLSISSRYFIGDEVLSTFNYFSEDTILSLTYDINYKSINGYFSFSQYDDLDPSYSYSYASEFTSSCIIQLYDFDNLSDYSIFAYTDYNEIESVTVNTDDTITQKVARAWESTWNLPVFSWTQNSFITAPFSYITALFGLGSDNSINYLFTYFASISICWLVFDLIMYVPNLAHRWLDRSAIE